jgi:hypothetical protein
VFSTKNYVTSSKLNTDPLLLTEHEHDAPVGK